MFNNFFSPRKWWLFFGDSVGKIRYSRLPTDSNIVRRMRFVCCMTKSADMHCNM